MDLGPKIQDLYIWSYFIIGRVLPAFGIAGPSELRPGSRQRQRWLSRECNNSGPSIFGDIG
jgi:hypothetical protein